MAYTDDAVKAKLSALNDTQEGIVTVAQWIMFHRRHADRTAQLWMQRLKDSTPSKRLNMIYLANEVVQQSKARRKNEFVNAYSPIIAEATVIAYKGSSNDVQQKLRRVVEVWRQRMIFDLPTQDAIEKALDDVDRSRGQGKKPALGGSLFSNSGPSAPAELRPLIPLQTQLTKSEILVNPAVTTANVEYDKLTNPSIPVPTPPVHAARLATLLKNLANAEGAVAESIKARQSLISGLEKMLETHKATLLADETQRADLMARKAAIESRKREVEDAIMRGLSAAETAALSTPIYSSATPEVDPPRPDIEELTPPPPESFTPTGTPNAFPADVPDDIFPEPVPYPVEPIAAAPEPMPASSAQFSGYATAIAPGADLLSSLTHGRSEESVNGNGTAHLAAGASYKKRKMSRSAAEDEFAAFAGDGDMAGIDADVAGMLES
ncbi:DUF618-domain-containing protein [Lepidopterella palustris CBS 459.81]|uniref:DUF618-domain-containing protein n=1 Tax=Lepidopterella palustris CBS 459.81 TaxID=1314670 RepID=A0A8E2J8N1_9PEZI|nr:DUF618-domain-containing protein [Lepidopterella palustris CBS 459.81]